MMITFTRIVKYGWQAFLRNGLLSVSTVSIMILAAAVFEGLILFNVVGNKAIESIQEKIDISVYFKSATPEDTVLGIKRSLENLSEVREVEYVSREQALDEFKKRHSEEEIITQALIELEDNPLLASLNIKSRDPRDYDVLAGYFDHPDLKQWIEKVTYAQNKVVIERLINLIDTLKKSGITLIVFLAFLAIAVTFNTIRLAIFSNSEQINIMRLVGASNSFIRGPYIIEGVIYGIIAATVGFILLIPAINFVSPYINNFIPQMDLKNYFQANFISLFFYQILFCVGLGAVSSIFTIRRYLKI